MNLIKRNNKCAHKFSLQAERETRKMEEKTLKLVGEGGKKTHTPTPKLNANQDTQSSPFSFFLFFNKNPVDLEGI